MYRSKLNRLLPRLDPSKKMALSSYLCNFATSPKIPTPMKPCSTACDNERHPPDIAARKGTDLDCGWCIKESRIKLEAVFNSLLCQFLMQNAVINEEAYEEDSCHRNTELDPSET